VEPGVYDLSLRLRGQVGSNGIMPASWPDGSIVVLLDGSLPQIELAQSARGLARHYRIGAAARRVDDPDVVHKVASFDGLGLRPYSPAHLRAKPLSNGDLNITWVRRTRIDGDSWASFEVPLGEVQERYVVQIRSGGALLREVATFGPTWTYSSAWQAADGAGVSVSVAQVSDRFGAGVFTSLAL